MTRGLPKLAELGELEPVEVFEYYDRPVLFSCRNARGQLYLVVLSADNPTHSKWLYVPVSASRYQHVREGRIDLHEAFALPEAGFVLVVTEPQQGEPTSEPLAAGQVPGEWLPEPGERIEDADPALVVNALTGTIENRASIAVKTAREQIRLRLDGFVQNGTEVPSNLLGRVISDFQDFFRAIGQSLRHGTSPKMKIAPDVKRDTDLFVKGFAFGSFSVDLQGPPREETAQESLFPDEPSLASQAGEKAIQLISMRADAEDLSKELEPLRGTPVRAYKKLLQAFSIYGANLDLTWFSTASKGQPFSAAMPGDAARALIQYIEQTRVDEPEPVRLNGALLEGADFAKRTFTLTHEDVQYSGSVAEEALPDIEHVRLGEFYDVVIQTETIVEEATGSERTKLRLTSLKPVKPEAHLFPGSP